MSIEATSATASAVVTPTLAAGGGPQQRFDFHVASGGRSAGVRGRRPATQRSSAAAARTTPHSIHSYFGKGPGAFEPATAAGAVAQPPPVPAPAAPDSEEKRFLQDQYESLMRRNDLSRGASVTDGFRWV